LISQFRRTKQFKKDVKRMLKRRKKIERLLFVVSELLEGRRLAAKYKDHALKGQYEDWRPNIKIMLSKVNTKINGTVTLSLIGSWFML